MAETQLTAHKIPHLSVEKILDYTTEAYVSVIRSGLPVKMLPTVMLWGEPGIGKSQLVYELAHRLKEELGLKDVIVNDVRLILFNPVDLRGIPAASEDKKSAIWLQPEIFKMQESKDTYYILFLDEISASAPSVQAAAYQIALDRKIGEHKLPDNVIVIAAGNRVTDKSVAYKMPRALANRMLHFSVESNFESWKKWAVKNGINSKIIGFLSFRRDYLLRTDGSSDELAYATPRSWEMASNILNYVSDDIQKVYHMIAGVVGSGVALEFQSWLKVYGELPSVEAIFSGKNPPLPKSNDALYALTSSMVEYAKEHKNDKTKIANSIIYADRMPPDFSAALMRDYLFIEPDYKKFLMTIPEFMRWLQQKGTMLNGLT